MTKFNTWCRVQTLKLIARQTKGCGTCDCGAKSNAAQGHIFAADTKGKFGSPQTSPFVDKHNVHWMEQSPPPPVTVDEPLQGPAQQWVNGFEGEHAERDWADEFAARFTDGADPNQWMEEFSSDMDAQQAAREAGQSSAATKRCRWG